jgi:proton-coupled amino acid transporter
MVGPAILYLPHSFAASGYAVALPTVAAMAALYLYSSRRLIQCVKAIEPSASRAADASDGTMGGDLERPTYPELAELAFGLTGKWLAQARIALYARKMPGLGQVAVCLWTCQSYPCDQP